MAKIVRTKKTFFRLMILLSSLVLVGSVAVSFYFYRLHRLHQQYMGWRQEGLAAARRGDNKQAVELLAQYLRRRRDPEALENYVNARLQEPLPGMQHLQEASIALKMLLAMQPSLESHHRLLEIYQKLDQRTECVDEANAILADSPGDVAAQNAKIDSLILLKQYAEALSATKTASTATPSNLRPLIARIWLRHQAGDAMDDVLAEVGKLFSNTDGDPRADLLKGYALAQYGQRDQAMQLLRKAAAERRPDDEFAKVLLNQFDAVESADDSLGLVQNLAGNGGSKALREAVAPRLWQASKWKELVEALRDLDPNDRKSDTNLLAFKVMALAQLGEKDRARSLLDTIVHRDQAVAAAWAMQLNELINGTSTDPQQLKDACNAALSRDPYNPYLRYYLADAFLKLGESDLAVANWRIVAGEDVSWGLPLARIAETLLAKGQVDEAMQAAATSVRRNPNGVIAIVALARAWSAAEERGQIGRSEDLLQLVNRIQSQLPGEVNTLTIKIELLCKKGQRSDAIQSLNLALSQTPPPTQQALLEMASLSHRLKLGLENDCFHRYETAYGMTPALAYAEAMRQGSGSTGSPDAVKQFDEMRRRAASGNDLGWAIARAEYLDVVDTAAAKTAWRSLGDRFPNEMAVQQGVLAAKSVRGDKEFTQKTIDRLHRLTGDDGLSWRLANARLVLESSGSDAQYQQTAIALSEIVHKFPDLPDARALLAEVLVRQNHLDGAVEHMGAAARLDPGSVGIALRFAALLQLNGEFERANEELNRITPLIRTPDERRETAVLLSQQGQTDRAIELFEELQRERSGEPPQLLLAVLYSRRGERDKAQEVINKLMEHPDLRSIEFAVDFYLSGKRIDDAKRTLGLLDQIKLDPGIREMAWGTFYRMTGSDRQAIESFRKATEISPQNANAWRAVAASELAAGDANNAFAAIEKGLQHSPEDRALKTLSQHAQVIKGASTNPEYSSLVAGVMQDPLNASATMDVLAAMVQSRDDDDPAKVILRLQNLVDQYPNSIVVYQALVQSQLRLGRIDDALAVSEKAVQVLPSAVEPLALKSAVFAAGRRFQEMDEVSRKWKQKLGAQSLPADVAIATANFERDHYVEAADVLKPHLAEFVANPERFSAEAALYAASLQLTGRGQSAAEFLWPLAAKSKAIRLCSMSLAGEKMGTSDAGPWLDQVGRLIPADQIDEQMVMAESWDQIGRRLNDPTLISKASEQLANLSIRPDATADVVIAAAMQSERNHDPVKAEALFRRALALNSKAIVVRNNLAMLLAAKDNPDLTEAKTLAKEAVQGDPRQPAYHDTAAFVSAKMHDYAGAIAELRQATKCDPNNPKWRVRLGSYLADNGNLSDAAQLLQSIDFSHQDESGLPPDVRAELQSLRKRLNVMAVQSPRS